MDATVKECGECTLCCRGTLTVKVNEHKVYPGHPCPHVTDEGCGIYDDPSRPAMCGSYGCEWLKRWEFPEYVRPDRCGFILTMRKNYMLLTADFNGTVDGVALLQVIEMCRRSNLTLFYTVKTPTGQDQYIRGSIMNHSERLYKVGTMNEVFEPVELFHDE